MATVEERVERRLSAILAADVAGYSRLMGLAEEGTLAALKAIRRELADPKIAEHRGRIVKTTGDGMLAEFASVVDAVRCAVEVQRGMAERNAGVPADTRIQFRIGINLGDIIIGWAEDSGLARLDEARGIVDRLRTITPNVISPAGNFRDPEQREMFLSGLRLAVGEPG